MANVSSSTKKSDRNNLVMKNEILKSQVFMEEKARKEWMEKWGFFLDYDKICIEEASKRGISEEKFKQICSKINSERRNNLNENTKLGKPIPVTSSGMIGWPGQSDYYPEKFGPLYVSPRCTMEKEPRYSHIFLG